MRIFSSFFAKTIPPSNTFAGTSIASSNSFLNSPCSIGAPTITHEFSFLQIENVVNAYLRDEFRHVRDEYHRARVLVERFRDDGQMTEVDMVRGFVEDEEPWPA